LKAPGTATLLSLQIFTVAFVVLNVIPEVYQPLFFTLWGLPLYGYAIGFIFLICSAIIIKRPLSHSLYLLTLFGVGLVMAVIGCLFQHNFDIRFFFIDCQVYVGLLAGYMVVRVMSEYKLLRTMRLALFISWIIGFFTLVTMSNGLLAPESVFNVADVLAYGAPLVITQAARKSTRRNVEYYFWVVMIPALVFAIMATRVNRTSLILLVVVVCQIWVLRQARLRKNFTFGIAIVLIAGFGAMSELGSCATAINPMLASKLEQPLDENIRALEAQTMFDQMGKDIIYGWGFGSRFESVIILKSDKYDTSYAFAPHIGLLAFLQKGGVLAGLLLVVVPFVTVVRILLKADSGIVARSACLGVLVYFTVASLSGGWTSLDLFFYGACYSMATLPRERRASTLVPRQMASGT
jgi:phage terminase large subunit-like protein